MAAVVAAMGCADDGGLHEDEHRIGDCDYVSWGELGNGFARCEKACHTKPVVTDADVNPRVECHGATSRMLTPTSEFDCPFTVMIDGLRGCCVQAADEAVFVECD